MTGVPGEPTVDAGRSAVQLPLPEPPGGSKLRRLAAAVAAATTLFVCATFTLGTVLLAPLGVLAARTWARRRGGHLTRGAAWVGAVFASFIAVPLVFAFLMTKAPPGTVAGIRAAMDSAQTRQKPADVPDWLERVAPPGTQQRTNATHELFSSGPFVVFFGILSVFVVCSILGTIAGSIGWVASMLLGYTITGRWIPRGYPPAPPIADE